MGASLLTGRGDTGLSPMRAPVKRLGLAAIATEQCRHQRCLRGFGDSFCAAPCVTDDDCADLANAQLDERAPALKTKVRACRGGAAVQTGVDRLLERGLQDVRGRVTTDQRTLRGISMEATSRARGLPGVEPGADQRRQRHSRQHQPGCFQYCQQWTPRPRRKGPAATPTLTWPPR